MPPIARPIELAREKGRVSRDSTREAFLASGFARRLPDELRDAIAAHGIRNSHLLAIAPAGTISLLANNVSSGIEPIFAAEAERRVLGTDGRYRTHRVIDHALQLWQQQGSKRDTARAWSKHGRSIRSPISRCRLRCSLTSTTPFPKPSMSLPTIPFEHFEALYRQAHALGLKGCTVFRPNPVTGAILSQSPEDEQVRCCGLEREAD